VSATAPAATTAGGAAPSAGIDASASQVAPAVGPTVPSSVELTVEIVPAITRAEIEAHVRFLASDELHGRPTGTPEAERAARYLAAVLERAGVTPAGDDGSFLQAVPIERLRAVGPAALALIARDGTSITAEEGVDFDAPGSTLTLADVEIVLVREPADLPAMADARKALFVDAPGPKRRRMLAEAGFPEGRGFALLVQPGRAQAGEKVTAAGRRAGPLRRVRADGYEPPGALRVHGALLERLRRGDVARLSLATKVERELVPAWNVVGRIDGTDAESGLDREALVLSAHYDHLPDASGAAGSPPGGRAGASSGTAEGRTSGAGDATTSSASVDVVHNGADDDASGCAAVLEIAGALRADPAPMRTVVFLLATGEEIGLLGTNHYLDHPAEALERTVANLNFEMIGRPDALAGGPGRLWLTGFELSNLGPAFAAASLPVVADPRPEQGFFERSDNYAFVLRGIVGQSFSSYDLHADYHEVTDEADRLDYVHMEAAIRAAHAAVSKVTAGEIDPRWVEGRQPKTR
jgi:hypothetical protein